eukprot:27530-Eustigmatos_ZCMA.PRE.1
MEKKDIAWAFAKDGALQLLGDLWQQRPSSAMWLYWLVLLASGANLYVAHREPGAEPSLVCVVFIQPRHRQRRRW